MSEGAYDLDLEEALDLIRSYKIILESRDRRIENLKSIITALRGEPS